MKIGTRVLALGSLVAAALASGCAKPDWIEQTLVTVDVTGVWVGSPEAAGSTSIRLELEQQGPMVRGTFQRVGAGTSGLSAGSRTGLVDGSVKGDVFSFRLTDQPVMGEVTVAGDEMTGYLTSSGTYRIYLQRIGSSPRPTSQP